MPETALGLVSVVYKMIKTALCPRPWRLRDAGNCTVFAIWRLLDARNRAVFAIPRLQDAGYCTVSAIPGLNDVGNRRSSGTSRPPDAGFCVVSMSQPLSDGAFRAVFPRNPLGLALNSLFYARTRQALRKRSQEVEGDSVLDNPAPSCSPHGCQP
jgi:hypothetical protein